MSKSLGWSSFNPSDAHHPFDVADRVGLPHALAGHERDLDRQKVAPSIDPNRLQPKMRWYAV